MGLRIPDLALSQSAPIARFMGPTSGPPGPCRPQMGPCWLHEPCSQGGIGPLACEFGMWGNTNSSQLSRFKSNDSNCLWKFPINIFLQYHSLFWLDFNMWFTKSINWLCHFSEFQIDQNTGYLMTSRSYLTGVTAAELRDQLTNMNVIESS